MKGDDKVESVVITKVLVILLALYRDSFPLPVQAGVWGYYPTKSNWRNIVWSVIQSKEKFCTLQLEFKPKNWLLVRCSYIVHGASTTN